MSQLLQKAEKAVTGHDRIRRSTSEYGPHDSKVANKLDPRFDSDHGKLQGSDLCLDEALTAYSKGHRKSTPTATVPKEGKTAGNTNKPYPDDILTSGTVGAHNTEVANNVEQRVVPDRDLSDSKRAGA